MKNLAQKFININIIVELDNVAVEKNHDYELERTYWIFEDESALWVDSFNQKGIIENYGFNPDHEQL